MIELKMQTEPYNCVSACIAMITGESVLDVTEKFHERYKQNTKVTESTYFGEIGLAHEVMLSTCRETEEGHIYTLNVPSLNIVGGSHAIILHYNDEIGWVVFDPNKGRKGRKYYVNGVLDSDLAVQITAYVPVVKISESALKEWREKWTY